MVDGAYRKVAIACQGGGSLTAFTAGVLKKILCQLDMSRYRIVGLSGTSGGAICGLITWYGLLCGDPEKGARILEQFWDDNTAKTPFDAIANSWLVYASWLAGSVALPEVSPYDVPEVAHNELQDLLEAHIPFAELAGLIRDDSPLFYVGAVNESSGQFKVFTGPTITAKKILASAAIPSLFRAVRITDPGDEGVYWDGLFSQNPPVREFVQAASKVDEKPDELWVIRINPQENQHEPTTIQQIETRRNTLSGNLSLNQELFFLETVNDWVRKDFLPKDKFKEIRIREIGLNLAINLASKWDRSPSFIHELMARGERKAEAFLASLE